VIGSINVDAWKAGLATPPLAMASSDEITGPRPGGATVVSRVVTSSEQ
jgi:hypothetical protein